jgi:hypothetical protein
MPITVRFVGSGDSFGSGGCYFYDKPVKWHLNYPDITSHASRVGAKRLILTHMSREMLARAGRARGMRLRRPGGHPLAAKYRRP